MRRHRAMWAALALGLVGFVALALLYEHDPFSTLDAEVAARVADSMPTWLANLARPFSWIGGWVGITVLCVVVPVVLVRERAWLDLAFFAVVVLGSQLAVAFLKAWFDRPRPDEGSTVPLPDSAAFPSGHATAGVATLGAVAVLATERLPGSRERTWVWVSVVALGLAIGLSRVILNVHYVTDVLAGWCLGLAWLAASLLVRDRLRGRSGVI